MWEEIENKVQKAIVKEKKRIVLWVVKSGKRKKEIKKGPKKEEKGRDQQRRLCRKEEAIQEIMRGQEEKA